MLCKKHIYRKMARSIHWRVSIISSFTSTIILFKYKDAVSLKNVRFLFLHSLHVVASWFKNTLWPSLLDKSCWNTHLEMGYVVLWVDIYTGYTTRMDYIRALPKSFPQDQPMSFENPGNVESLNQWKGRTFLSTSPRRSPHTFWALVDQYIKS